MSTLDVLTADLRGRCGEQSLSDAVGDRFRQGKRGQAIQSNLGGFYAESAMRRKIFFGSTPATGVTIPIFSNTTQQFVLYNPPNSGKVARILKASVGYISGTMVAGHLCYANQTAMNSAISGTAALIQSGLLGAAVGPSGTAMQLLTAVTVTAFTYLWPFGISTVVQAATATNTPWQMVDNVEGAIVVTPGSALAIAANVAAIMVASLGLVWEEDDLNF